MTVQPPPRQFLATGFRDVDTSGDTDACHRCLDLIAGIPFFNQVKQDSIRIIADAAPERVLDAGCGAGIDLAALALTLPEPSTIIGLDASAALLGRAAVRMAACSDRCRLVKGDILHMPFRDGAFGACRIDRVLQHIHTPEKAIGELTRALAPGGILVAFDNDWDTFRISLDDRDLAELIRRSWCDSFASGRIGHDLPQIFRANGLSEVHAEPRTLVLDDLALAEPVFDLPHLLERMRLAGELAPDQVAMIKTEFVQRAREGRFSLSYTGYLVVGRKPE
ncbi:MAG TPA: methyltransferase domain-containing protein [Methanoregula sp.]|nr:methyltransferase domain-containing protein [Methanoregula sp.]